MDTANSISTARALLWTGAYFCLMLLYTAINELVWKNLGGELSAWLNIGTITLLSAVFIWLMVSKYPFVVKGHMGITAPGLLMALACAVMFYLLLDCLLDPLFESIFKLSEEVYAESIASLSKTPAASFVRVCLLAPIVEEILMRGFVLGGLKDSIGWGFALLISSLLFAVLHFNMVQTLSALVCGLALGLLYLKTGSLPCCMLAHCGYNAISFFTAVMPR